MKKLDFIKFRDDLFSLDFENKLKSCCPTSRDNTYHIKLWHNPESFATLLFEADDAECKICEFNHATQRCPFLHPLNKTITLDPIKPKTNWIGASCHHCGGKHLGIYCICKD